MSDTCRYGEAFDIARSLIGNDAQSAVIDCRALHFAKYAFVLPLRTHRWSAALEAA